jgi:hypothetical protein
MCEIKLILNLELCKLFQKFDSESVLRVTSIEESLTVNEFFLDGSALMFR